MSTSGLQQPRTAAPPLPSSARWLAGLSLLVQVLALLDRGARPLDGAVLVSMAVGAVLVAWISYGVLIGARVRTVLVWVVLVLVGLLGFLDGLDHPPTEDPLRWATLLAEWALVVAMLRWTAGEHLRWRRWACRVPGALATAPSLRPLVAVAALVGALGGLVVPTWG